MDVHPTKNVSIGIDPYPSQERNCVSDLPISWPIFGILIGHGCHGTLGTLQICKKMHFDTG